MNYANAIWVSGDFFRVLGVQPSGRGGRAGFLETEIHRERLQVRYKSAGNQCRGNQQDGQRQEALTGRIFLIREGAQMPPRAALVP